MMSGDALRDPATLACVRDEWQRVRGESRRVCAVLAFARVFRASQSRWRAGAGNDRMLALQCDHCLFCGMQAALSFTWRYIVGNGG